MPPQVVPGAVEVSQSATAIVGCLIDVSNSMRKVLETGKGDGRATERLRAVLQAALKLARAEQQHNPNALMFIGAFGLDDKRNPVVDLCGLVDALLGGTNGPHDQRTGHDHLIALANEQNVPHVTQYIQKKLTEEQARIVHAHLQRNRQMIDQFVNAIPPPEEFEKMERAGTAATVSAPIMAVAAASAALGPFGLIAVGAAAAIVAKVGSDHAKDKTVDNSEALKLARQICDEWLDEFKEFVPRKVSEVVSILEKLQDHSSFEPGAGRRTLLDDLRPHLYGWTPMRVAINKALDVFVNKPLIEQRVLVMISDGRSTDGDPLPLANKLKEAKVIIAGVFLTADTTIPRRQLHDQFGRLWPAGQKTLFSMASKVAIMQHPIPVLASMGWEIPSSGECALYTTVCTSDALEEFCSVLLSAHFGETDALLDVLGRMDLDTYINDEHMRTRNHPSNQGDESNCYAHAAAAVLHMAILRIHDREGGCPSVADIRARILREFPPGPGGRSVTEVLTHAIRWYRPLRFRKVDEDGARQAVLHRRPVLATFRLSPNGWDEFCDHFHKRSSTRNHVLESSKMVQHHFLADGGGHAVVMVKCDPTSLTFLNSWGSDWGNKGSFSIQNASVLEPSGIPDWARVSFYDIYWIESDLTPRERQAYEAHAAEKVRARAIQHPSLFELEVQCPQCKRNAPVADFTGSIRSAICPLCRQFFRPEPGHLVQALYLRAGLDDVS